MNFNIILRRINKYKAYFLVNIIGLTLAFVSVFIILSYVWSELNYDRFHNNAHRIVRLTMNSNTGKSSLIDARIYGSLAPYIKNKFPEVEAFNRLMSWRKATVTIGENSFYTKRAFSVDSGFFNFFSFKLLQGDKENIFNKPAQVAISKSMAITYFGTTDVIGKKLQILYQMKMKPDDFTIAGVFEDFPSNSHFKADFLCSYPDMKRPADWTYSYLLLSQGVNYIDLQKKIQIEMDSLNAKYEVKPLFNLQPITDIHFYSHKSRELRQNANIQSVILLFSGALIILIIALINFVNLNYVQFISNIKNRKIRLVNGASKLSLSLDFLKEILILAAVVIFISILIIRFFTNEYGNLGFELLPIKLFYAFIIGFLLLLGLVAFIPSLFWNNTNMVPFTLSKKKNYRISMIIQLGLSIIAITSSITIRKQVNYINKLHPQAHNTHIIIIPENTGAVVHKYESFKENLLKHSEIISVTAASEPPAGIVTDNFKFSFDNQKSDNKKSLNTLIIDTNFFSFLKIKPIAGTTNLTNTASLDWERKAMKLWQLSYMKRTIPVALKEEVSGYSDKFIINRTALKTIGVDNPEDVVGKDFDLLHPMTEFFPKGKIVGVVDDFHYTNMFTQEKPLIMVCRKIFCHNFLIDYNPSQQKEALAIVREEWDNIYPDIPLKFEFIGDEYHKVYEREYYEMQVLILFSFISLLLSIIGIFAALSFNLKLRTKEIGIRKVNGASVFEIIYLFNTSLVKSFIIAFVLASPIAYYAMRKWLQNFAYQTGLNWWIFLSAALFVLLIILLTVSLQTLLYARKNPIEALRYE